MRENEESMTAKICAFSRAYHSFFEKNKVFDDYLAFDFLGHDEYESIRKSIVNVLNEDKKVDESKWSALLDEQISPITLSRISYAENRLAEFAKNNDRCQYIICGAGFDSFAFRNENPEIEIYELDHPDTQNFKINRIKELEWIIPDNVHFVPIDFVNQSIENVLLDAGFNPDLKTFVAILGVSYYLSLDTLKNTFKSISGIVTQGSQIVIDYPDDISWKSNASVERVEKLRTITEKLGEKMTDGFSYEELNKALKQYGFEIIDYQSPVQIQQKYFSKRKDNLRAFENVHFMLAELTEKRKIL